MGFLMVMLLVLFYISFCPKTASANTFDVTSYGAIGDGDTDDTDAFVRAWGDLCADSSLDPTLIIPPEKTFLIRCVKFTGPCQFSSVHFKLLGDISAPKTIAGWKGCNYNGYLMYFTSVHGLVMEGPGQLDGQGSIWWRDDYEMLRFESCDELRLKGTRHVNGPKRHISVRHCDGVDLGDLYISAPEHSPNTDGIDINWSSHVNIHDSVIESGDDCIAISSGTYDINITGITCGPGHGISIGSLGRNGAHSTVEQVLVQNCNITATQNGLRIKTSPHGSGYARSIVFEDINLINVKNPIIIDQHYCIEDKNSYCPAPPSASAVKVSDVRYQNIHGSSASKQAITINCAARWNCTEIVMNDVGITGEGVFAHCENASGDFGDTTPEVNCSPAVRTSK
ncbi:hypothetical protein QVD17_11829 [Tagetes erecta]|uniref:Polygalacturonase n=1 Tax=Tagetes erecta TaxID=13708 RepID=A0AAD8NVB4_TARER|nr:hypothetical protein QVD17_11829 [Tagetes erecta]